MEGQHSLNFIFSCIDVELSLGKHTSCNIRNSQLLSLPVWINLVFVNDLRGKFLEAGNNLLGTSTRIWCPIHLIRINIVQVNPAKKVNFQDIVKMETLIDDEHVALLYLKSRVMRLSLKDSLPFLQAVQFNMKVRRKAPQTLVVTIEM